MGTIKEIRYLRVTFKNTSPLAIGSGNNDRTDKDLLKGADGVPYIPATSIAGVIREQAEKALKNALGDLEKESKIIFYDGVITESSRQTWHISIRDSVRLDDYKTAVKGAKFDMEILEPGVCFETLFEQEMENNETENNEKDYLTEIAEIFRSGQIRFGGKTTRGYGDIEVEVNGIQSARFDLSNGEDADKWLKFNPYVSSDNNWKPGVVFGEHIDQIDAAKSRKIVLSLKQTGGISIRRYTTKPGTKNRNEPDMEQLSVKSRDGRDVPVVPGTSWAGAFRHRMKEFGVDVESKENIFGFVSGDRTDQKAKSKLIFSESQLENGKYKTLSRNAIDRFTGGTVDGALFTERVYYGGTTNLIISWCGNDPFPEKEKKALAAAITDLHYGFLTVGGETSIGRGIFTIEKIDGDPIGEKSGQDFYKKVYDKLSEVMK